MFVYVVARDFGFAPNPFGGTCSLATCKPEIRRLAQLDEWVIGTGSKKHGRQHSIVYAMRVTETITFDEYWSDPRFQFKKPHFRSGKKHGYGDNIYRKVGGEWSQLDSHHSKEDGSPNPLNITTDTRVSRVLLSDDYVYWGRAGPTIPGHLLKFQGEDLLIVRGQRHRISDQHQAALVDWIRSCDQTGYCGTPLEWRHK
ncbi:hypothetical protein [Usitatibacter rugosus]|uniref:Nmad2 family putative nucleotide modification protein n=1 Tax=Usitatibacter rugosus TaxID=2732067 RepID=UPI001489A48C|nr:hypothetical protein [Usitatibacter rugosus]